MKHNKITSYKLWPMKIVCTPNVIQREILRPRKADFKELRYVRSFHCRVQWKNIHIFIVPRATLVKVVFIFLLLTFFICFVFLFFFLKMTLSSVSFLNEQNLNVVVFLFQVQVFFYAILIVMCWVCVVLWIIDVNHAKMKKNVCE